MNFKIADFKVVNRVANTLAIDVSTTVFDGMVTGILSLMNLPDTSVQVPSPYFGDKIYTEIISVNVQPTDNVPEIVKAAAAKQLGVTYL